MSDYCLKLAGLERHLPYVDINDDLAYASFVVISDTELVSTVAPLLAEKIGHCEAIVTAEAKGIALAYEISRLLGIQGTFLSTYSEEVMRLMADVYPELTENKALILQLLTAEEREARAEGQA